jgi:Ca2+-binding EF-hand superfamily protein
LLNNGSSQGNDIRSGIGLDFIGIWPNGRLDGGITKANLKKFVLMFDSDSKDQDFDLIFKIFDRDNDGRLSWSEFSEAICPKDVPWNFDTFGKTPTEFADYMQRSLARVFTQEIENQRSLEVCRAKLYLSSQAESCLFDKIDASGRGLINIQDFDAYVKSQNPKTSLVDSERAFRRLDLDQDGTIIFEEFILALRHNYILSTYSDYQQYRESTNELRDQFSGTRKSNSIVPKSCSIERKVKKSLLLVKPDFRIPGRTNGPREGFDLDDTDFHLTTEDFGGGPRETPVVVERQRGCWDSEKRQEVQDQKILMQISEIGKETFGAKDGAKVSHYLKGPSPERPLQSVFYLDSVPKFSEHSLEPSKISLLEGKYSAQNNFDLIQEISSDRY